MNMDKSWMQVDRNVPAYWDGVRNFIEGASKHADGLGRILCPCIRCKNRVYKLVQDVYDHLIYKGILKSYTRWIHHGEDFEVLSDDDNDDDDDGNSVVGDQVGLRDLLDDLQAPNNMPDLSEDEQSTGPYPNVGEENSEFDKLLNDSRQPLYPGCKFSKLEFLVKLLHLKTINRLSNKAFNMNLELIKAALHAKGETLPSSYYEAKTLMRKLGLGYTSIHACKNDCVLFWKDNKNLEYCPICTSPRYKVLEGKGKKIPEKILRYFPLKPRLQRLFMSRMTAEDMRWHSDKRVPEANIFKHPADSQAWEEFDKDHEWFSRDPRNVRLGLVSDGFNPFGNMSNAYSMWPVMLMPYNLPPWKCMKEPFIFLSLLIPGPKAPGNDIDVYLQPLIDELKELWQDGVETYDAVTKRNFRLHAALLWTINDFPAFGNLSGWMTKGKLACPNCNKDTSYKYLTHGGKLCYMNHIRFLPPRHPLKRQCIQIQDGNNVSRGRPKNLSGDDLLSQLEHLREYTFGKADKDGKLKKKRKRSEDELNWTKKSIFFELPYWRTNRLRHNLDVMHIEKNICESVLGTILKLEGKTKDNIKTRMDLEALGIRQELHLVPKGDKFIIPHAPYTLSPSDKKTFCEWLKSVKFPDGFASNISRCVNADGKITGMKSHDCHVLLQRLLPVAIRGFLSKDISTALIELGIFFKELCCKTLRLDVLEKMEKDIAVILCKLENIFPPSFFDVMVHLAVHLPHEAKLGGPVHYRWMYPIERFLHTLKQYVRNKARPEGSIAEAYIDSECLTFCSMYLRGIETRFNREERNHDGGQGKDVQGLQVFTQNVRPFGADKLVTMNAKDYDKARYYVLHNSDEIASYFEEHMLELEKQNPRNLEERQQKTFTQWFQDRMQELRKEKSPLATDELYALSSGPDHRVRRYSGCIINGIRFHTKDREVRIRTQNSGVVVQGEHQSKNTEFYGVLTDIIELEYLFGKRVYLFKCAWWDVGNRKTGIQNDGHFTSVNVSKTWYENDPFVLASQACQVFYVDDTKLRGNWKVVHKVTPRNVYDFLEKEEESEVRDSVDAYQQEEHMVVNGIVQDEQTGEASNNDQVNESTHDDVEADEVDLNFVMSNRERNQREDAFIVNEDSGEEDDTLMDYCSEHEDTASSDDDTDID